MAASATSRWRPPDISSKRSWRPNAPSSRARNRRGRARMMSRPRRSWPGPRNNRRADASMPASRRLPWSRRKPCMSPAARRRHLSGIFCRRSEGSSGRSRKIACLDRSCTNWPRFSRSEHSRPDEVQRRIAPAPGLRHNRADANKPGTNMSDLLTPQPPRGGARPVLVAGFAEAAWLTPDGRVEMLEPVLAARRALVEAPVVCHAPATFRKLKSQRAPVADILELYAFVRPASFCLPTPRGIALAMGLPLADHAPLSDQARLLAQAARALLGELTATTSKRRRLSGLATLMARAGWVWGPEVQKALEIGGPLSATAGVAVWEDLPEWQDQAPEAAPSDLAVEAAETRRRLADLLGPESEQRPQQADYAEALVPAFAPRPAEDAPNVVLAEAGTGVGKTLGYLAPAVLWAERNKGAVWISTFTRHLQNQIDQELDRLYPNPALKAARVVLRKGRENYLCLLNLAELSGPAALRTQEAVTFGLMARWAMATRDGDLAGGDLPGWLGDILGPSRVASLADRRGECVYSACPHYGRCFIERSVRKARKADTLVANHALVMSQAALARE